jgi:phospholipid-binding lipoprotein MlaA
MLESQDRRPGRGAARPAAALLLALSALSGARVLAGEAPKDPLEHLNRATFAFNDALDRMLARPAAKAYKAVVPEKARQVVSNFLSNLAYPTVIVNDALQAKFKDAGADTARFVTNTVVGVGGLFDPATRLGLPVHDEDFGQTLGVWGVPAGPYLVLPFLGPSDLRDAPAKAVDTFTRGDYYLRLASSDALSSKTTEYGVWGLRLLDLRTALLATDETLQQAFDRYAVVRNAYVARREYLVRDGNIPEETYDEPMDDVGTPAPAPATAPVQPPAQAEPAPSPEPQPQPQPPEGTAPREPLP